MEEPKYKMITADGYKTDDIIKNISRIDPSKQFEPSKTLLFFDELQDFPEIATSLKFFAQDNKKFQISKVASGARFKDYRGCIEWLSDTGGNIGYE